MEHQPNSIQKLNLNPKIIGKIIDLLDRSLIVVNSIGGCEGEGHLGRPGVRTCLYMTTFIIHKS